MKHKRLTSLVLALLSVLSLTGCSNWDEVSSDPFDALSDYYRTENEETDETLQFFALPCASRETADPITCSDGAQATLGTLLYEPLYRLDAQFAVENVLAESQIYHAESFTYAISLRRDVLFSDGSPLTAEDAAYTLNRALTSARYGPRLAQVSSIETSGNTLLIQLKSDNRSFTALLDIPLVKSGTEGNTFPLGTGPYCFSADTGTLTPNAHWWQDTVLPFAEIQLRAYKSSDAMTYAFSARDVHVLFRDLTSTEAGTNPSGGDYTDADTTVMQFIGFNTAGLFGDAALRSAANGVINRRSIVNAYLLGHGVAASYPVNPACALYPEDADDDGDIAAYTAALERVGLTDSNHPRTVVMLVNEENAFRVAAAQDIAHALSRGNLTVEVSVAPWDAYCEMLQSGHFDLYYGECRLTADWDVTALVGTGGALNYGRYANVLMDTRLHDCVSAASEYRTAAFSRLYQLWQEDVPLSVICFKRSSLLLPSGAVSGAVPTAANPFYGLENWHIEWAEKKNG